MLPRTEPPHTEEIRRHLMETDPFNRCAAGTILFGLVFASTLSDGLLERSSVASCQLLSSMLFADSQMSFHES